MRPIFAALLLLIAAVPARAQDAIPASDLAARYADASARITAAALADSAAWERLAYLADTFGPRFSGTQSLEDAIDWILSEMQADGLEQVRGEPVMVPRWVRGNESLLLIQPRGAKLAMMGLGGSIGTPVEGLEADVLVVDSFDELEARAADAVGKIVLFNAPFTTYGQTVQYRVNGAVRAAQVGAVGSLVRSVASSSLYTPHTGTSRYEEGVRQIPHAAITVEDALMMRRMQDRGQPVRVRLHMDAMTMPDSPSRNVVAELRGTTSPGEIVVMGGHIDSWDVGTGAMDDGGGCVAAWQALKLLHDLGLRPRRTIRVVLWTNEENGTAGGRGYRDAHLDELDDHVLAIESDGGTFAPTGFGITGKHDAYVRLLGIAPLLQPLVEGDEPIRRGGGGADIAPIMRYGVPGMGHLVVNDTYFDYHHTHADTPDKVDPRELARNVAVMAIMAYVVADMPERLERDYVTPGQ